MTKKTKVYFHADCPDGFGASFAAWKKLGNSAEYIPVHHGSIPSGYEGCDVYILDFTWPRAILLEMALTASSILVLDHHKSAMADLEGLDFATFDMNRSGCGMSWDHFHPGEPMPKVLSFVQERDLWRFAIPETDEFCLALDVIPRSFATWDAIADDRIEPMLAQGRNMRAQFDSIVEELCSKAVWVEFLGRRGLMINGPDRLNSACGDVLSRKSGTFGLVWRSPDLSTARISLRSKGEYDVSEMAGIVGGGGHRNAAGIVMPLADFLSKARVLSDR